VFLLQIEVKLEDIENNNSQLGDLKQQLALLIQECEQLYSLYEERRNKVRNIRFEAFTVTECNVILGNQLFENGVVIHHP
jgi:hypothetical protein